MGKPKATRPYKQVLKSFKQALTIAGQELKLELHEVGFAEFWAHSESKVSEWEVRKYGGFAKLKKLVTPFQPTPKDQREMVGGLEARRERVAKNAVTQRSMVLRDVEEMAEKVFKGRIAPISKAKLPEKKTLRVLNAVISDVHFGADVGQKETGVLGYGPVEEARRLAAVLKQIIEYKPQHRAETELNLLLLGDIIQNQLHDPRDGAPLAEQQCRAIHLLSQMLAHLSANFKSVKVHCQTGNHGRYKSRHEQRATNQKWDSAEMVIYYSLKAAASRLTNVTFDMPLSPYGIFEVFGAKGLYTHGDTFINPGYPGKAINVKGLETQINKINASLPDKNEIKFVIVGHVHTGSVTFLPNGCVMMTNGALIPVDEYAVSIGMLESTAGQFIFESVPGHPVGDIRFIQVDAKTDQNKELDKIIVPWTTF